MQTIEIEGANRTVEDDIHRLNELYDAGFHGDFLSRAF